MPKRLNIQVPNRDSEYWDLSAVSRNENYFVPPPTSVGPYDPYWANVSLLMHMEGADASKTFTDSSAAARTVTPVGDAQITTSRFKYGSASCLLDGTGDYLSLATDASFNFGTGDFTVEGWFYTSDISTYRFLFGSSVNSSSYMMIGINVPISSVTYTVAVGTAGVGWPCQFKGGATLTANTWMHIAVCRQGSNNYCFINGQQCGSTVVNSQNWSMSTPLIGQQTGGTPFLGSIDDFRVTKGVCRYNAPFTPPTVQMLEGINIVRPGLENGVTTNWASYASDVSNRFAVYNLKALTTDYVGRPTGVAVKARNLNVHYGPAGLQDVSSGAFNYLWVSYTKGDNSATVFQRLDDPNITINPATVYPSQSAFFNSFRDRFSGHFDAAASPVIAAETAINQISVFKASLGTPVAFTGYSPIILNSTQFLKNELFTFGDNIVFYTKDTVSSATKIGRTGTTIYCRVERDNYATEYTLASGLSIRFLELTWYTSNRQYLIYRDSTSNSRTLESAVYTDVMQELVDGVFTPSSISLASVVISPDPITDSVATDASITSLLYASVVNNQTIQESVDTTADIMSLVYASVIVLQTVQESVSADAEINYLNYIYDPVDPPIPPTYINGDAGTDQTNGTFTPQSITLA